MDAFDLEDLIGVACDLLSRNPDISEDYRRRYRHVLVDECQDMNEAQYQLLKLLQPPAAANLCLVGDPDQAIYGFRGADATLMERFLRDYPGTILFRLTRSYRCSERILRASAGVIREKDQEIRPLSGMAEGVKINIVRNTSDRSEAEYIARTIEGMLGGLRFFSLDSQVSSGEKASDIESLGDFAILCRLNEQLREIRQALQHHNIPYQCVEDPPFFRREPMRTLLDFLNLAANPDNPFLKSIVQNRLAQHEISGQVWQRILPGLQSVKSVKEMLALLARELFAPEAEDLNRLLNLAEPYGTALDDFLKFAILGSAADTLRPGLESVSLMTIHAAKGLEFACVFIPGCEEGLLPYSLFSSQPADEQEEKRLLYVGMTRARRYLFLTHAGKRLLFGKSYQLPRSRFLEGIEQELLELSQPEFRKKEKPADRQRKLFDL